jgi:hypothetical protein
VRAAWTLAAELDKAHPARLREMFRRMVESIDCYFEQEATKGRSRSRFCKGIITLRNHSELSQLVSRGDWTPFELFLRGIAAWDTALRERLDAGSPLES